MAEVSLILGGVRSGKSKFAEDNVLSSGKHPIYIATALAFDIEMQKRIHAHKLRRQNGWTNCETAIHLADTLLLHDHPDKIILVDCLTVWLGNLMHENLDMEAERHKLLFTLPLKNADVVFVASEVGLGIMADNAMARQFGDEAGLLNQEIATKSNHVYFVTAGLPLKLKG